jgi:hypothetical protein
LVRYFGVPAVPVNRKDYREKSLCRGNRRSNCPDTLWLHTVLSKLGSKNSAGRYPNSIFKLEPVGFGFSNTEQQAKAASYR